MGDQSKIAKAYARSQKGKGIVTVAIVGLLLLGGAALVIYSVLLKIINSISAIVSPSLIAAVILGGVIGYLLKD
jgi:hypothetical protein